MSLLSKYYCRRHFKTPVLEIPLIWNSFRAQIDILDEYITKIIGVIDVLTLLLLVTFNAKKVYCPIKVFGSQRATSGTYVVIKRAGNQAPAIRIRVGPNVSFILALLIRDDK